MKDGPKNTNGADTPMLPAVVDRAAWQARIDQLRVKEKAHTRVGDALAAERRRLPMVEVDPQTPLIGADGPVAVSIDIFDGRSQLIAYFLMWHTGKPAAEQSQSCTFNTAQINELSYLQSRDVTYATFCQEPNEESSRLRDFMGWTFPWYSVPRDAVDKLVVDPSASILVCYLPDMVTGVYGDQPDLRLGQRADWLVVPNYGSDRVWPAEVLGGLAQALAAAFEFQRWRDDAGRPPDHPVVADPDRARRRPRTLGRHGHHPTGSDRD